MLLDNKGGILKVKEKLKEPPKEMSIWGVIEKTCTPNRIDGYNYNEKYINSMEMHLTRS